MRANRPRYQPLLGSVLVGLVALFGGCGGGETVTIEFPEGMAPPDTTKSTPGATEQTGGGVVSGDPSMYTK